MPARLSRGLVNLLQAARSDDYFMNPLVLYLFWEYSRVFEAKGIALMAFPQDLILVLQDCITGAFVDACFDVPCCQLPLTWSILSYILWDGKMVESPFGLIEGIRLGLMGFDERL